MYRLGENGMLFAQLDPSMQTVEASAMQSVLPGQDGPSPDEGPCPCPPPTVIYRDKIITKFIDRPYPVQGPTVYVDRYIEKQSPGWAVPGGSSDQSGVIVQIPAGGESGLMEVPEDSEMAEGGEFQSHEAKKFPWWLIAVGGGLLYMFGRKKKNAKA